MSIGRGVATTPPGSIIEPFEARVTMTNVIPLPTPEKVSADKTGEILPAPPPLDRRSPFRGWERGEEIAATYHSHDTRSVVGKAINGRGGKEVHALILGAIDAGILTAPGIATKRPSLRLLIPNGPRNYCAQFDLTNQAHRKKVREVIWPIILEHKDEVIVNPGNLETIIKAGQQKKVAAVAAAKHAAEVKRKVLEIRTAGEQECIMFGVRLWPRVDQTYGEYNYDQIRAAAWTFRDLNSWFDPRMSPGSKAICIRNSLRWVTLFHRRHYPPGQGHLIKVFALVGVMADLHTKSPDAECIIPHDPKVEAEW
jgi:hypothetical protein